MASSSEANWGKVFTLSGLRVKVQKDITHI